MKVITIRLADLLPVLADTGFTTRGDLERTVTDIAQDSRRVRPGNLFACIAGGEADGHDFADEALARGATAFLVRNWLPLQSSHPQIKVSDVRRSAARLAAVLEGNPSSRLRLVGVTGTNGKTTVSHLLEAILTEAGLSAANIGSIGYKLIDESRSADLTTPEAPELQAMLRHIAARGGRYAVVEVSSHALAMGRLEGCEFDLGIFTNLSHDHLDFHRNRHHYLRTKAGLFAGLGGHGTETGIKASKYAVINGDDPAGREIAALTPVPVAFYGLSSATRITAEDITFGKLHSRFRLIDRAAGRDSWIDLPLPGICNVYNALAAATAALGENVPLPTIVRALARFTGVPGRCEIIDVGGNVTVIIDYAHNPDGLSQILTTARKLAEGKVISVFGGRGRRDRSKRALMGRTAARLADRCLITSDDPYDEDPELIIRDIREGVMEGGMSPDQYRVIPDREQAIGAALEEAGSGSVVVITGKGHERSRVVGNQRLPYSDREAVLAAVNRRHREPVP